MGFTKPDDVAGFDTSDVNDPTDPASGQPSEAVTPGLQAPTLPEARDLWNIPKVFNVKDYEAECDGRTVFDAVAVNGDATVTSVDMNATAADVGKVVIITDARTRSGLSHRPHITTIASINSESSVELAAAPSRSGTDLEMIIVTNDQAAFVAANAAAAARGGGYLDYYGHTLVEGFSPSPGVRLRSDGYRMSVSLNSMASDLAKALANAPSRLIVLGAAVGGAEGGTGLVYDVQQWPDDTWVKHQGGGFDHCIIDGVGFAGFIWQAYSICAFATPECTFARWTNRPFAIGPTSNQNFIATADGGLGSVTDLAAGHNDVTRWTAVNNGSALYGARGPLQHGDQTRGNLNDTTIADYRCTLADAGDFVNLEFENCDTTDAYGAWNGIAVIHSASSGRRSTFNSVLPAYELLSVTTNPTVTETVWVDIGTYTAYVLGGDMTIVPASAAGQAAEVSANVSITDGNAASLVVTKQGYVTVAFANTPTSATLYTAGGEAVDDAHAPVTQSILLEEGAWVLRCGAGGGTVEVTADTGVATGLAGSATSAGNTDIFTVTDRGLFDLTVTGDVNFASVTMEPRGSRARSIQIRGDGRFLAKKANATLHALDPVGFHTHNLTIDAVMENTQERPQFEPGAKGAVTTDAQEDNTPGGMIYGRLPLCCEVRLAATQAIPTSTTQVDVPISWPTPAKDTGGFWNAGDPTKITIGSSTVAHANNNVMACLVFVQVTFENDATGQRFLSIFHNSTEIDCDWETGNASQFTRLMGYAFLLVSPGDVITANVTHGKGSDLNITNANRGTRMTVICF